MSILKACGLVLLCLLVSRADTVTTRDSRSWNGTVKQVGGGVLTLSANFPGSTIELRFGATALRSLEFNPTNYNPGAPPTLGAPSGSSINGTVYLKGDPNSHVCEGITIDSQTVTCKEHLSWSRRSVSRIFFN